MYTKKIPLQKFLPVIGLFLSSVAFSQTPSDSVLLEEVIVRPYDTKRSLFRFPVSAAVLNEKDLQKQPNTSAVSALNSLSGVRMEERSPGSYRLAIRGSLLRSPYGVRNIKFYIDEFPLTDAGGNTYFQSIDPASIKGIQILKGPEGSLFGANTGGVVLINPIGKSNDSNNVSASITSGSYGLVRETFNWLKQKRKYKFSIQQGYQSSNGYRNNSALQRNFISSAQQWDYASNRQIRSYVMYSDLNYRTPGGLTLAQFQKDPSQSRVGTAFVPGTSQQKAGVHNKTIFAGILHETTFLKNFRHVLALYGGYTDFRNPYLTNYEMRFENSLGMRTYLELNQEKGTVVKWKWNIGMEGQRTKSDISNYGNNKGTKDTLQSSNKINASQYFFFTRLFADIKDRWVIEAAVSMNHYQYNFRNIHPLAQTNFTVKKFDPQFMPRVGLSYKIVNGLVWRASVSKGYSPPTLSEVRPSNNYVSTLLQPEKGWNYETGFRIKSKSERLWVDALVFYYRLQNAIVRRVNASGADYYVNAGGTDQRGIETQFTAQLITSAKRKFLCGLQLRNAVTYYDFKFATYKVASSNYSGNEITGIPRWVIVTGLTIQLPANTYIFLQHNFTERIPLNDGNTAYAPNYHLLQAKAGWQYNFNKWSIELFAGADNLFNQSYSLGNDLNAFGGLYYNAAPLRNYYGGLGVKF